MILIAKKVTDEQILIALLSTDNQKAAAQKLKISQQTLSKRVNTPQFREKLNEHRREVYSQISGRVIKAGNSAIDTLTELLKSPNEMTRYNSSSRILSLVQQTVTTQDILLEIEKLKQQFNEI